MLERIGFREVEALALGRHAVDEDRAVEVLRLLEGFDQVADVVEDIVENYLDLRARPEELFVDTVKRLGVEPFKERVYATR